MSGYISRVAIINTSSVVSDENGFKMANALNLILMNFCNDWGMPSASVYYVRNDESVPTSQGATIHLMDSTDISGLPSYRDIMSGKPYAKIFAKTILDSGGVILYENTRSLPTVSQYVSHELFEMLVDAPCIKWWLNPSSGAFYAGEVADPVNGNKVIVRLSDSTPVVLSDWVLPAWSNMLNTSGPFNHLDTLTSAFELAPSGYAITSLNGTIGEIYGSSVSDSAKAYMQLSLRTLARFFSTRGSA